MNTLLLIDGDNLVHRIWHSINSSGIEVKDEDVVSSFGSSITSVAQLYGCTHLLTVFDTDAPSFRRELFPQYKATRAPKQFDVGSLRAQIKLHVKSVDLIGYEADDVIATITQRANAAGTAVKILTTDSDYLALVRDSDTPITVIRPPMRRGADYEVMDLNAVIAKYSLLPAQLTELKILMGDASDNIRGVSGVGIKTATDLLTQYGDIVGILKNIDSPAIKDKIRVQLLATDLELMRKLVTLVLDAPVPPLRLENYRIAAPESAMI